MGLADSGIMPPKKYWEFVAAGIIAAWRSDRHKLL
jgi:hypothetical protein